MMDRKFAILCWSINNNINAIINQLPAGSKITVFFKHGIEQISPISTDSIQLDSSIDTIAKARNYIIRFYKTNELHAQQTSFLHMLEDSVDIIKEPTQFITDIEYMLRLLDVHTWFNTICDPCNYVYSKYNPRLKLQLDAECYKDFKLKNILFTSHANTSWTIYDLENARDDELYLSEDYTIAMFYIIEYFSTLRNNKQKAEIRYMNQYPTVESEYKVFEVKKFENADNTKNESDEQEKMKVEDAIFKGKNIDYHPDNNIDTLLEDVYNKLTKKIGIM